MLHNVGVNVINICYEKQDASTLNFSLGKFLVRSPLFPVIYLNSWFSKLTFILEIYKQNMGFLGAWKNTLSQFKMARIWMEKTTTNSELSKKSESIGYGKTY